MSAPDAPRESEAVPADGDDARLAALRDLALLDTPAEEAFDRLTRLATRLLRVPVSLVTLVDADRQFFKSQQGLSEPWASRRETPLSHSFCRHVVLRDDRLVVQDARTEPTLRDNPAIEDLGVVAYAGFPLRGADGRTLGSFCAIDRQARVWTEDELSLLQELAALAQTELDLWRVAREAVLAADRADRAMMERAAVIESSSDGIYTVDIGGRCTMVNPAVTRILGFEPDELLGENAHDRFHHHHEDGRPYPEGECPVSLAFREGRTTTLDGTVFWHRDGRAVPCDVTASPLTLRGQVVGAVVTFRDVTAQRRAADALRLLAGAGAELASSLDPETTLRRAARAALPMLGDACVVTLARSGAPDRTVCAAVDPAREARLCGALREPPAGPPPSAAALLRADGMATTLEVPLRGRAGDLGVLAFGAARGGYDETAVALATDLARRVANAVENALLYQDARAAAAARDEVLAVVSHDLRNPVHTVMLAAAFLSEVWATADQTVHAQLAVIRRAAGRADRLIRDLLDVTRVENGQLQLEPQRVSASELLDEAAQVVTAPALARSVTLHVEPPPDGLMAVVDRSRVLQLLDNLLGNAIKFTPAGGSVWLRCTRAAKPEAAVEFVVRDSGPGIPEAQQAHLFRRFWQARRADRRGVGLGLSIVKGIVDAHGGSIHVESAEGAGTTVRVVLPLGSAPAPLGDAGAAA